MLFQAAALDAQVDGGIAMHGDSVEVRLVDVDVRTAAEALGRYLDRPVVIGAAVGMNRVTLETPHPIAQRQVLPLLRGLLESQGFDLVADSAAGLYRLVTKEAARPMGISRGAAPATSAAAAQAQGFYVIHLRHARAAEVAATVNALYGRSSALGEIGERPPTLSRELQQSQISPPAMTPPPPATPPTAPQAVSSVAGRPASLTGDVTIVPDPRGNSLLIRASAADFDLIEAAVEQLDVRPLQVLIEVLIAEIRKDRSLDFGVNAKLPPSKVRGTPNTTIEGQLSGAGTSGGLGDFAVTVMNLGGGQIEATLRAAASRGDATIVSRPLLLAANNEKAEINVGSQRPFVQVSRVLPTDNTARDQVVQYKDVGTRLSILPTISSDGYVMLQIVQEVNAATAEQEFNAPVISTRSVDTRLLIRDGQTIVLGGLTDREGETTQSGVPILSSIPLLGGLFGHYNHQSTDTELFLFLTPRVIRDDVDVDDVTLPLHDKAKKVIHE